MNTNNSFKVEVIADSSGEWASNAIRYATSEEAEEAAVDLAGRWLLVREWRVAESPDPVNYRRVGGRDIAVLGPPS
jgi:hypothetical protein